MTSQHPYAKYHMSSLLVEPKDKIIADAGQSEEAITCKNKHTTTSKHRHKEKTRERGGGRATKRK